MSKGVGNEKSFLKIFKQRLINYFVQGWNEKMSNSENLKSFYSFKSFITPELFLTDATFNKAIRNILIKFRLGVSQINCHRYKYYKNTNLLICPLCKSTLENEFHVLFKCPEYSDLRFLLPPEFRYTENETQMYALLSSDSHHKALANYLLRMFKRRSQLISS